MKKRDLAQAISEMIDEPPSVCQRVLAAMIEVVADSLASGEPVVMRGFGQWEMVRRKPRVVKDWGRGESVRRPAQIEARFRPGSRLKVLSKRA